MLGERVSELPPNHAKRLCHRHPENRPPSLQEAGSTVNTQPSSHSHAYGDFNHFRITINFMGQPDKSVEHKDLAILLDVSMKALFKRDDHRNLSSYPEWGWVSPNQSKDE